ncbi:Insertion element IS2A protein [Escherichia coli]|nr:transposase insC [Escherichia coli]SQZ76158.1 Insertion element IS2A protein [Escherichia coli]SRA34874.1 Insertion element IS2A protein [Escherichia coli]SRA49470.1 Insertion element IS2A protein [Escherichia coli]SRA50189.1 Insertion element IS2A protein [Escherichia coli]
MIDVLGPEKRRRRTTQEKIAIVQQSFEPGMTVSLVARQHGVAASQLFLWRKQYQEGSLTAVAAGEQVVPASELAAAMKQITQLIEVMLVGRGGDQAVGQATLGIDTNVGLHAKVPLIAFLGLMHLRIALLLFVLGRAGCLNDGGIHQSALGHHDACFGQPAIDGLEQLTGQLMLLEQVAEIHDGGAIRQGAIQG